MTGTDSISQYGLTREFDGEDGQIRSPPVVAGDNSYPGVSHESGGKVVRMVVS